MTIKPTVADLLDAGRYYKGIDSSYVTNPEPLFSAAIEVILNDSLKKKIPISNKTKK